MDDILKKLEQQLAELREENEKFFQTFGAALTQEEEMMADLERRVLLLEEETRWLK